MAVAITAAEQDVWPVRMLVTVTGLTVGTTVTVYRVVAATRTALRGADEVLAADTSLVVIDAELPFGTPVSYVAAIDGVDVVSTASTSHTLVGGKVAVTDAIAGDAAEVVISAWPDKPRTRVASAYVVTGRTVVVAGPMGSMSGQIELFTDTDVARTTLTALVDAATSGVLQIRQPGGYPGVDGYYAITGVKETRHSQDGIDPRRRWTLDVAEVEAWAPSYAARGWTLADLADAYTGQTLADLAGDFATLLAVAQADWGV